MFLVCSRTLDLASIIETLAVDAAVERALVKAMTLLPFVALERRILAAERDISTVLWCSSQEQIEEDEKGERQVESASSWFYFKVT